MQYSANSHGSEGGAVRPAGGVALQYSANSHGSEGIDGNFHLSFLLQYSANSHGSEGVRKELVLKNEVAVQRKFTW